MFGTSSVWVIPSELNMTPWCFGKYYKCHCVAIFKNIVLCLIVLYCIREATFINSKIGKPKRWKLFSQYPSCVLDAHKMMHYWLVSASLLAFFFLNLSKGCKFGQTNRFSQCCDENQMIHHTYLTIPMFRCKIDMYLQTNPIFI